MFLTYTPDVDPGDGSKKATEVAAGPKRIGFLFDSPQGGVYPGVNLRGWMIAKTGDRELRDFRFKNNLPWFSSLIAAKQALGTLAERSE